MSKSLTISKAFNKPNEIITTSSNHLGLVERRTFNFFLQMAYNKLKDDQFLKEAITEHRELEDKLIEEQENATSDIEIEQIQKKIDKSYDLFDKTIEAYIYKNRFQYYGSSFTEMKKNIGMEKTKNWEILKLSLEQLQAVQVEMIFYPKNSKLKKGTMFTLLGLIKYTNYGFEIEIPIEIIKSVVDNRRGFTPLSIVNLNLLKSKYSLILYEFFMKYKNINIPILKVEEFYDLLGLYEVDENKVKTLKNSYARFSTIKQQIIDKSLKEISEKLGLIYEYKTFKQKARVTEVAFKYVKTIEKENFGGKFEDTEDSEKAKNIIKAAEKQIKKEASSIKKNEKPKTESKRIKKTEEQIKNKAIEEERVEVSIKEFSNLYESEILNLDKEILNSLEEKAYDKFLRETNATDNKIMKGIFEKSKKTLIVEEYKLYKEETSNDLNISTITQENYFIKNKKSKEKEEEFLDKEIINKLLNKLTARIPITIDILTKFSKIKTTSEMLAFFMELGIEDVFLEALSN